MSEDANPKSGGRLLSKVVKFITRPTTDWADLNRVDSGEAEPSESSLALKEMIERKRRNDFVRKREFDMLRKVRRRQMTGAAEGIGASSIVSSQVSAQQDERERTLEKIDEIEQQMSRAWLGRNGEAQSGAVPDHTYDRTTPSALSRPGGVEPVTPRAFAPTTVESDRSVPGSGHDVELAPTSAAPILEQPPAVVEPVAAAEPQEEPATDVVVGPEIEEVAIRFANGDTKGAEASLLDLLGEGGELSDDVEAWLTLFDLYRAADEPDKFDGAAVAFVGRFGRSAPQWELAPGPASEAMPIAAVPSAASGDGGPIRAMNWTAPSNIGIQSIAALNATLARLAPPWRIDWRRVKAIEPEALPALVETLQRWADTPVRLRFFGAEALLGVLAEQSPSDRRDVDPQWWTARLALLRVMHQLDEFELVALNYCVTYEMSPPAWEEPRCEFAPLADSGETLPPPEAADEAHAVAPPTDVMSLLPAATQGPEVARLDLAGVILDDATEVLRPLVLGEHTRSIEFNCRQLRRVDFGAAGTLLNWAAEQQGHGRRVVFRHVNRLVAAFFNVIGITETAQVRRRMD